MKKYKFRLEPLLRYREYLEHQKKLEVAKAGTDVLTSEQTIAKYRRDADDTHETFDGNLASGMDSYQFRSFCNYWSGLENRLETEQKRREHLLAVLEKRQRELSQKSVERKVIGNLKDRQKETYYTEMLKEEQKELDDTIILRHIRNTTK